MYTMGYFHLVYAQALRQEWMLHLLNKPAFTCTGPVSGNIGSGHLVIVGATFVSPMILSRRTLYISLFSVLNISFMEL